jgi:hypothetical protein
MYLNYMLSDMKYVMKHVLDVLFKHAKSINESTKRRRSRKKQKDREKVRIKKRVR